MQRFNINWTAKALVNQMEKGKVNYDNAVQRSLVWDTEKKSLLIHSMIYGYAIPAQIPSANFSMMSSHCPPTLPLSLMITDAWRMSVGCTSRSYRSGQGTGSKTTISQFTTMRE